jgi:hypothetical protein
MELIDEKIIRMSRTAMAFVTILGFVFVAFGYWMFQTDAYQLSKMRHHNDPFTTHVFGILSIALGISLAVFSIKAIVDNKPGLILNSKGILKNPNSPTARLIPWNEIVSFGVVEYRSDTRLVVSVKYPGKYNGVGGGFDQRIKGAEARRFGSPVTISATFLKIDVEELENLCNSYLEKYLSSRSQFS